MDIFGCFSLEIRVLWNEGLRGDIVFQEFAVDGIENGGDEGRDEWCSRIQGFDIIICEVDEGL